VVLLSQVQKKFTEIQKRGTQAQMDKVLRQRRERTRLKPQTGGSPATVTNYFFHICLL
jgi:hypothetical protein